MQIKFLKQIVEQVAGISATKIVDLLANKKDINEFLIAKKLGLTINQTRNLLYRLSNRGILSSTRKKDKRKGWYIYFWTLNILKSLEILEDKFGEKISNLEKELLDKKSKRFYKCTICGEEVTEETALLNEFACKECGEVYILSDNVPHVQSIFRDISKLKRELGFIRNEREKEQLKQDKKFSRKIKTNERKKKKARKETRIKRLKDKKQKLQRDKKLKDERKKSRENKKLRKLKKPKNPKKSKKSGFFRKKAKLKKRHKKEA